MKGLIMRIMALDIGETRVGVAVSDPGERVASPVAVLPASEVLNCAKPFQRALEDWEPEARRGLRPRAFGKWRKPYPTPAASLTNSLMSG